MYISFSKIIPALSITVNLTEMTVDRLLTEKIYGSSKPTLSHKDYMYHSKRTTYISMELGKILKLNCCDLENLYICSMLHDIGISCISSESFSKDSSLKMHCLEGANIFDRIPKLDHLSDYILYHHENFDGSGVFNLKGTDIPLISQIIRLSDLIESSFDTKISSYNQRNSILQAIVLYESSIFSNELVNAFSILSLKDSFWFNLDNSSFIDFILEDLTPNINIELNIKEFESIAEIFASMIDAISSFTAKHSRGIASLAYKVSRYLGYDEEKCLKMKIAGLFHDIGKLAIPHSILDKNAALSKEEFALIKSHVYYTKIILDRMESIPDISAWASNHHEKLNGNGYPQRLSSDELSEESRIMAVCDIYQALTEDRPYRCGMSQDKAFEILHNMVYDGSICGNAVNNLKNALNNKG